MSRIESSAVKTMYSRQVYYSLIHRERLCNDSALATASPDSRPLSRYPFHMIQLGGACASHPRRCSGFRASFFSSSIAVEYDRRMAKRTRFVEQS